MRFAARLYLKGCNAFSNIVEVLESNFVEGPPLNFYEPFKAALRKYMELETRMESLTWNQVEKAMHCPACTPKSDYTGKAFLFVDGFSGGRHYARPSLARNNLLGQIYFKQAEAATSVDEKNRTSKTGCCDNHLAGNHRDGDQRCDINGIFGSSCPHGFPYYFFGKSQMKLVVLFKIITFRYG